MNGNHILKVNTYLNQHNNLSEKLSAQLKKLLQEHGFIMVGFMGIIDKSEGVCEIVNRRHTALVHVHGEAPKSGTTYNFQYISGGKYQYDGVVRETKYLGIENNQMGHLIKLESVRQIPSQTEEQQKP